MKIIVCIKQVPGTTNVEIDEKTGVLKRENITSKINPYDLFAIEEAIKLKEKYGARIIALTMGPPQASKILEEANYMGVDEGVLLTDRNFAGSDVLATAYTLSQGIKKIVNVDLIICGKQTTDGDTAQVGAELATFLDVVAVNNVEKIVDITDKKIILDTCIGTTDEKYEITLPIVISLEKDINVPRLPSYKLKQKFDTSLIKKYTLNDFENKSLFNYGLKGSPTQVEKIFSPEKNNNCEEILGTDKKQAELLYKKLVTEKFLELGE